MDTGCAERWFLEGSRISIECTAVENAYADNMDERSELEKMICSAPEAYAEFIFAGEPANHFRTITEYK